MKLTEIAKYTADELHPADVESAQAGVEPTTFLREITPGVSTEIT